MNNFWDGFEKQALKIPKVKLNLPKPTLGNIGKPKMDKAFTSTGEGKVRGFLQKANLKGFSAQSVKQTGLGKRYGF